MNPSPFLAEILDPGLQRLHDLPDLPPSAWLMYHQTQSLGFLNWTATIRRSFSKGGHSNAHAVL
jgi:hypothetical protein